MALRLPRSCLGLLQTCKAEKPGESFAGVSIDILDGLAKLRLARDLQSTQGSTSFQKLDLASESGAALRAPGGSEDGHACEGGAAADTAHRAARGFESLPDRADPVRHCSGIPEARPGPATDSAHAEARPGSIDSHQDGQRAGEGIQRVSRATQCGARTGERRDSLSSGGDAG